MPIEVNALQLPASRQATAIGHVSRTWPVCRLQTTDRRLQTASIPHPYGMLLDLIRAYIRAGFPPLRQGRPAWIEKHEWHEQTNQQTMFTSLSGITITRRTGLSPIYFFTISHSRTVRRTCASSKPASMRLRPRVFPLT